MKQINNYDFYEMGYELHSLERLFDGASKSDAYSPLTQAKAWLSRLLNDELVELTHCRHEAAELLQAVDELYETNFLDEKGEFNLSNDWNERIHEFFFWQIRDALTKFEHNFAAELRGAASYYIPRIGIYATQRVVDESECQIPANLLRLMTDVARTDFHDAGRCLAFDLPTASGYHAARSVEGMLASYCEAFTGEKLDSERATMGDSLAALKKVDGQDIQKPNPKTIRTLEQIKNLDRNPLMHPRAILTTEDAIVLFNLATSAIVSMLVEMRDRSNDLAQPSFALIPGARNADDAG